MATAARQLVDGDERRGSARVAIDRTGTVRLGNGDPFDVRVADLTREGCRIVTAADLPANTPILVAVANVGVLPARLMWRNAAGYGCVFDSALPSGAVTAALAASDVVSVFPEPGLHAPAGQPATKLSRRARLAVLLSLAAGSWGTIAATALMLR